MTLAPERFYLIIYPPTPILPLLELLSRMELPSSRASERNVKHLPALTYDSALGHNLECPPSMGSERVEEIARALIAAKQECSTEVALGVAVPQARVAGTEEPILCLGTSRDGTAFPKGREPAQPVFILGLTERPQEHLLALGEIARLVSRDENVTEELLDGSLADEPMAAEIH